MKHPQFRDSQLIGYNCDSCNSYNDILTLHCNYCKTHSLTSSDIQFSYYVKLKRLAGMDYPMSPTEKKVDELYELHAKFFNAEIVLIRDMDTLAKRNRREELRMIIYQAKAMLTAHDKEEREENARKTTAQKEWILNSSSNDPNVTDAIRAVKERKSRQTKADKMLSELSALGIAGADSLVAKAIAKQTGQAITSSTARPMMDKRESPLSENCKRNLHKGCNGSRGNDKVCECKCHKPKVTFNPASLQLK